jgi:hypothetical protein
VDDAEKKRVRDKAQATWPVRMLKTAKGRDLAVVMSMLAAEFDDLMWAFMEVAFPGFSSITTPFLCSAGKIDKRGRVCADMISKTGNKLSLIPIYDSEIDFRDAMRRLADRLALNDMDRAEFFAVAQNWLVCDYRLDPTLDPRDPDAKRLVDGNRRLAH